MALRLTVNCPHIAVIFLPPLAWIEPPLAQPAQVSTRDSDVEPSCPKSEKTWRIT